MNYLEIELDKKIDPDPIWFAKAGFQLGYQVSVKKRENLFVIKIPNKGKIYDEIWERAVFLKNRFEQELPVDPLPDGTFPDVEPEELEGIIFAVNPDKEEKTVRLDFNRSVKSIAILPHVARFIALMLNSSADSADPANESMRSVSRAVKGEIIFEDGRKEEVEIQPSMQNMNFFKGE